jgi:uncharacterized membrane protein
VSAVPRRLWAATGALSLAGVAVAGYLTLLHWRGSAALCSGPGDCEAVNASAYADIGGVPIALLGLGMYLTTAAASGVALLRRGRLPEPWLLLGVFTVTLSGAAYSAWLTWVEVYVLDAICPWCVTSAALTAGIWILSALGVLRSRLR